MNPHFLEKETFAAYSYKINDYVEMSKTTVTTAHIIFDGIKQNVVCHLVLSFISLDVQIFGLNENIHN